MNNTTRISSLASLARPSSAPRLRSPLMLLTGSMLLLQVATQSTTFAGSATWNMSPSSRDWNTATNWTPTTIPNGPSDTATFASSNKTKVSLSATTEVNSIVFDAGASAFTISAKPTFQLKISGVGITNNSVITQNFVTAVDASGSGTISFLNSARAGSGTVFTNNGGTVSGHAGGSVFFSGGSAENATFINNSRVAPDAIGGYVYFSGNSTAANGTFINQGNGWPIDPNTGAGGDIQFHTAATAGNGTFTSNGGATSGEIGGTVKFGDNSSAGHAILTNSGGMVSGAGGGSIVFTNQSTAANATLIANGGVNGGQGGMIQFFAGARGGKARVAVYDNGNLDLSVPPGLNEMPLTIGSIEGTGQVFLGGKSFGGHTLTVGSNNLSTVFSGTIQDGGKYGGTVGNLTKIGTGTLVLTNANTYSGLTRVQGGKLVINGTLASFVQVDLGNLGGIGTIAGGVFMGSGVLSPGKTASGIGTLTVQSSLTFTADATYKFGLNSSNARADKVVANGVTIDSGAQFNFVDLGTGTLSSGTVFKVINNTSATPITGTFANLADGSTFTSNGNTYQANYQGGDGNDLTLTVVP